MMEVNRASFFDVLHRLQVLEKALQRVIRKVFLKIQLSTFGYLCSSRNWLRVRVPVFLLHLVAAKEPYHQISTTHLERARISSEFR